MTEPSASSSGVIKFQHSMKISSVLIRNTVAPIGIPTAPRSCRRKKKRESVMSINIPLELQRKCEQRWAARFPQPVATAPQRPHDGKDQERPHPSPAE